MKKQHSFETLCNDDVLSRLGELVRRSRRVESELVALIDEVDRRRLYAREGTSSMFTYCTDVLHLSESEAFLRIGAARAARKYPILLAMLGDGRLHLSAIAKLAPHLDALEDAAREELLARATYRSKRAIEELVAGLNAKPDVPTTIRKLPALRQVAGPAVAGQLRPDGGDSLLRTARPSRPSSELRPDGVDGMPSATDPLQSGAAAAPAPRLRSGPPAEVQPLAPARYKVTFTAGSELRAKLDRLRSLFPGRELAEILEEAVTEKIERVEARRFGKTKTPRKDVTECDVSPGSRHVPVPVKRVVYERDDGRCTFVSASGRRCSARHGLEFHHDQPFALGGDRSPENIRLLCRTHNSLLAESTYGREVLERHRRPVVPVSTGLDARRPEPSG